MDNDAFKNPTDAAFEELVRLLEMDEELNSVKEAISADIRAENPESLENLKRALVSDNENHKP